MPQTILRPRCGFTQTREAGVPATGLGAGASGGGVVGVAGGGAGGDASELVVVMVVVGGVGSTSLGFAIPHRASRFLAQAHATEVSDPPRAVAFRRCRLALFFSAARTFFERAMSRRIWVAHRATSASCPPVKSSSPA